uniref:DUS-like FMN-binding domain-containing protein n=1 Tax=Guillardia theta TaxID=55529 RepID=A0A7S4P5A0_GUITH|mmetsp:Transcript_43524/g.137698  ORF Transcript_43524/g.137698 Transcript_43524/m.137698 type:complete len:452 (+) Transcript_43524:63-1418(+)
MPSSLCQTFQPILLVLLSLRLSTTLPPHNQHSTLAFGGPKGSASMRGWFQTCARRGMSDGNVHPTMMAVADEAFNVAPMMKHTHKHWRYFFKLLSRRSVVYSEMIPATKLVEEPERAYEEYLSHSSEEYPLVVQLGGREEEVLGQAAKIVRASGKFSSLNFNCGCPSDTVAAQFRGGAQLMMEPHHVAACCRAMRDEGVDVSVKCRTGVEHLKDSSLNDGSEVFTYDELARFIDIVAREGQVKNFVIHARKAILGIGTIDNRMIPPLDYQRVCRLAEDFPEIRFVLNGGLTNVESCKELLSTTKLHGVMVGRQIINHPWSWARVDEEIYQEEPKIKTREMVLQEYIEYVRKEKKKFLEMDLSEAQMQNNTRIMVAPVYNLFNGEACCSQWRRQLLTMLKHGVSADTIISSSMEGLPGQVLSLSQYEFVPDHLIPKYDKAKVSVSQLTSQIV